MRNNKKTGRERMNLNDTEGTVVYKECGWCNRHNEGVLRVSESVTATIVALLMAYPNKEWGGVLFVRDGVITEIRIPKQEVSGSSVEFKEDLGGNGTIHSHNQMEAFWSTTDDTTFRDRAEYSVVINNKLEYKACRRVKLPCGGYGYKEVKLDFGQRAFESKIIDKRVELYAWSSTLTHKPIEHPSIPKLEGVRTWRLSTDIDTDLGTNIDTGEGLDIKLLLYMDKLCRECREANWSVCDMCPVTQARDAVEAYLEQQ